jgi:hypothetical protein
MTKAMTTFIGQDLILEETETGYRLRTTTALKTPLENGRVTFDLDLILEEKVNDEIGELLSFDIIGGKVRVTPPRK